MTSAICLALHRVCSNGQNNRKHVYSLRSENMWSISSQKIRHFLYGGSLSLEMRAPIATQAWLCLVAFESGNVNPCIFLWSNMLFHSPPDRSSDLCTDTRALEIPLTALTLTRVHLGYRFNTCTNSCPPLDTATVRTKVVLVIRCVISFQKVI